MTTELVGAGPGRGVRRRTRAETVLVFVFAIIPLTFIGNQVLGFQMSGWSWLLVLAAVSLLVLTEPLPRRAVGMLLPYLLFLGYACASLTWTLSFNEGVATLTQFVVPALVYLLAWRVRLGADLLRRLRKASLRGLGIAVLLAAVTVQGGLYGPLGVRLSPRPMAISLVVLFVAATLHSTSWRFTVLVGGIALAIAIATGSRMSSLVLIIMLLTSPSLGLRWQGRVAIAVACVLLVVLISHTEAFKKRFFFNEGASLVDVLTVSNNVNTAGRRELWPLMLRECSATSITGLGIASSTALSSQLSGGTLDHPHNEYIRSYCEGGWIGSILIGLFFLAGLLRSWAGAFTGRDKALHGAAGQVVLALLIFAITDNPLSYTAHFMAPLAAILGFSDRALAEAGRPGGVHAKRYREAAHERSGGSPAAGSSPQVDPPAGERHDEVRRASKR
jgi:O-antigen ligase